MAVLRALAARDADGADDLSVFDERHTTFDRHRAGDFESAESDAAGDKAILIDL